MKALIISLESFQKGEVPEEVQKYILSQHGNVFQILDESSKIKTNEPCKETKKSKRTQAVKRLNRIGERCILTGTFMSKSPVNAYDQMDYLKDGFFPEGMYAFAEHYVIRRTLPSVRGARVTLGEEDYKKIRKRLLKAKTETELINIAEGIRSFYGISFDDCRHIREHEQYTPWKNLDELWNRIGDVCFKVEREEDSDVPPKVYQTYDVQLTKEQRDLYLQLQNQHCTDRVVVDNGLKLYLRFQDICNGYEPVETDELNANGQRKVELIPLKENPKLDLMEEVVESIGNNQIVIWCSRSRLLYDAKERLTAKGYKCGVYDGKSKATREADYEAFAKNQIQIIFVNQASGGYGLDDFQQADYALFLCSSYAVEQRVQAEGRTYRGEITRRKFFIDLTCTGTCEDRVVSALKLGKELISTGTTDTSLFMLEE